MKKIFKIILPILLIAFTNSYGQKNEYRETIITEANKMVNSLKGNDYQSLINHTYPKLIEILGGKTSMLNQMNTQMKRMEDSGAKISDVKIGKPKDIYVAGDELHCLVPQKLVLTVPTGKVITNSFLLAISNNNGQNWYFLDTSQLDLGKIDQLFPKFNKDLDLPVPKEPKFIPN